MVQFFTKCPRSWFDFENFARSGPKSGSVFMFSSCSNPTVVVVLHCSGLCFVDYNLFFFSLLAAFRAKIVCCCCGPTLEDDFLSYFPLVFAAAAAACSWFCSYIWRHNVDESDKFHFYADILHIILLRCALRFSPLVERTGRMRRGKLWSSLFS